MSSKKRESRNRFKEREMERLGGRCPYCRCQMTMTKGRRNTASYDHIVSRLNGGVEALTNGQVMCQECNERKGSHSLEYFVKHRMWEMERGPNFSLLNTQRAATKTGSIATLRAMSRYCLTRD